MSKSDEKVRKSGHFWSRKAGKRRKSGHSGPIPGCLSPGLLTCAIPSLSDTFFARARYKAGMTTRVRLPHQETRNVSFLHFLTLLAELPVNRKDNR